jgi:hypothetical protein
MSAKTSAVKPMRGVRNETSLLFSVKDLAAAQPASPAANENAHGQGGSGLLDLEGLAQSYFEARDDHAAPGAALPDAVVVAAWHPPRPARPGIAGITLAAITGVASAALILMAAWMWIVPHAGGADPPARQIAATSSSRTPAPPAPHDTAALAAPAAALDADAGAANPAQAVPAATPAASAEIAAATPAASAEIAAATPAASAEIAAATPAASAEIAAAPAAHGTQRPARATAAPRPRTERDQSAVSSPAGAAECLDEVACLLATNPPACCTRPQSSQTGQPRASSPREEDTALPDKLDRAAIQAGIAQVRERVATCQRHGGTGTVSLSVRVDGDGRVSAVDVKSAPGQALGSCVAQAVEGARFARSRSGQRFTYPFVF